MHDTHEYDQLHADELDRLVALDTNVETHHIHQHGQPVIVLESNEPIERVIDNMSVCASVDLTIESEQQQA